MIQLAIAASVKFPTPPEDNPLLLAALEKQGIQGHVVNWDSPMEEWLGYEAALIGPTWDYHEHLDPFLDWAEKAANAMPFFNPISLIKWNARKTYLTDLEVAGVPIIPTVQLRVGSPFRLARLLDILQTDKLVLKPQVGASAIHTQVLDQSSGDDFDAHVSARPMMAQPFVQSVVDRGEASLTMIDGKYSHAVLKKPGEGDFRVQSEWGGSYESYEPTDREIQLADMIMFVLPTTPLYARVDFVDMGGEVKLMELELIEPDLHLRFRPESADDFAAALASRLKK